MRNDNAELDTVSSEIAQTQTFNRRPQLYSVFTFLYWNITYQFLNMLKTNRAVNQILK